MHRLPQLEVLVGRRDQGMIATHNEAGEGKRQEENPRRHGDRKQEPGAVELDRQHRIAHRQLPRADAACTELDPNISPRAFDEHDHDDGHDPEYDVAEDEVARDRPLLEKFHDAGDVARNGDEKVGTQDQG